MTLGAQSVTGTGFAARVKRGSAFTLAGFALSNVIRLGSNLILARLLFPEAFGIMALVIVVLVGLTMFSDIGITPSIQSSKRGDDPDFLNTAWTIQIIRSVILFAVACGLAWPMAEFYGESALVTLIPVTAISLLILGVMPTRFDTASRHIQLGRLTAVDLASQTLGVTLMLLVAWATASVWAMVVGNLASAAIKVALAWMIMPGIPNRPRWERAAVHELVHYGKWIFLSTVASFLVLQSDKLILGRYLSMEALGLYNIGFFLAGFPLQLGHALTGRLMIPIYRENPPAQSADNFRRIRRVRLALSGLLFALMVPLALGGIWLVDLLYDTRYAQSGPVVVAVALAILPQILALGYDQAALASGDSRGYFVLNATRACLLVALLLLAVPIAGVIGAALAMGLTALASYPLVVRLARRHGAWDGVHDLVIWALSILLALGALALHGDAIAALIADN
ncbi:MAG: Membrane protein involved in the export of O-antigen and teichoic acid [Rhodobacteraceae bacterium HLUCCA12]|nr:MAG: Membrane protein involved in the export of O-antigen and teichoic acid [Rhodobacteraceae bacterium HLUCCA12]